MSGVRPAQLICSGSAGHKFWFTDFAGMQSSARDRAHKGRAAQAHSKGRTCGVSNATFPCCCSLQTLRSQQQQSITQRWVHQREAQGPTPLKTATKLCRRQQHKNCRWSRVTGPDSRADDVKALAVVIKCPLKPVHASVFVERLFVLADRPCFSCPLSTVWLPSYLLTASTLRQQCGSVTPVHNMCRGNSKLARGKLSR
jgi:hypothetical protein